MAQNINVNDSYNVRIFNRETQKYENALGVLPASTTIPTLTSASKHKLVVFGDLEILGATKTVKSTITQISDNEMVLNNGEEGVGVSRGFAGLLIDRGTETDTRWTFYEQGLDSYWAPDHSMDIGLQENSRLLLSTDQNTAASPALSFFNDDDTGFYREADNAVAISTGGTKALSISPSQTFGLGTDSSSTIKLNIVATESTGINYSNNNASSTDVKVSNTNANYSGVTLNLDHTRGASTVFDFVKASANNTDQFYVRGDGAAYFKRNVGIGAEPSNYALYISDDNDGVDYPLYVQNSGSGATSTFHNMAADFASDNIIGSVDLAASNAFNHIKLLSNNVQVFAVSGTGNVTTTGTLDVQANTTMSTVQVDNGTLSAPAIGFKTDTDTGLYLSAVGQLSVTTGGIRKLSIDNDEIRVLRPVRAEAGSKTIPVYSFDANQDSGIFYNTTKGTVSVTNNDTEVLSIGANSEFTGKLTASSFETSTDGTAAAPIVTSTNDSTSGLYFANNEVLVSTNGTERVKVSNNALVSKVAIHNSKGTLGLPSYSFEGDTDTGLFSTTDGDVSFVSDGARIAHIDENGFTVDTVLNANVFELGNGTVTAPALKFADDSDTGIYSDAGDTDTIHFAAGADRIVSVNSGYAEVTKQLRVIDGTTADPAIAFETGTGFAHVNNDIEIVRDSVSKLVVSDNSVTVTTNLEPIRVRATDLGTEAAPIYTFKNDSNTGMFSPGVNSIGFATAGTEALRIDETVITANKVIRSSTGTTFSPSYSFSGDTDTGMYTPLEGHIGLSTNGSTIVLISNSGMVVDGDVRSVTSTVDQRGATNPGYTFNGDSDTGVYSPEADVIAMSAGGVEGIRITSTSVIAEQNLLIRDGTEASPGLAFKNSPDSGLFFDGSKIGFSFGGVEKFSVNSLGGITTTAGEFASTNYVDQTFLNASFNLTDLPDKAVARSTLGLTANGAGDIWIKRSGDAMTGTLTTKAMVPDANIAHDIGTVAAKYNVVHAIEFTGQASTAVYADLAERYETDCECEAGDVMIIGGAKEVTTCFEEYDAAVAGIVSENPAFKMNSEAGTDETHPYIALRGRVPCKVVGNIKKGDAIVTSGTLGHGMSGGRRAPESFAIALEDFNGDQGVIEVMVK